MILLPSYITFMSNFSAIAWRHTHARTDKTKNNILLRWRAGIIIKNNNNNKLIKLHDTGLWALSLMINESWNTT